MAELSILIPARNEMFLARTVQDILENIEGDTEIIVGLDGAWADPAIPDNPRVTILHYTEPIGQRAMTNKLCLLSKAKYVAKVDAHCAFDKGFDVKLMADMQNDWTMVPTMRNLHVFDWVCPDGHRRYQGPSGVCKACGKETKRDIVWIAKTNPQSNSFCFDSEPHFQYNKQFTYTEEYKRGAIIGYKLLFEKPSFSPSVISLLADFADSHHLPSGTYSLWNGENVTVDAMSLSSINNGGCVGSSEIFSVGNELKVGGVATSPVLTEVVKNSDSLSSTSWQRSDKPSIDDTVCKLFISEHGTSSITTLINSTNPVPTSRKTIKSNVVKELNNIFGGEFVYNEKTSSFHNGSVTLTTIHDKLLTETMSLQGSFFMLTREKYWELNICDENFGSWGSQGIEVAVKTWLSGGRVMVNHKTWYAHLFRTQGGDFSFPYPQKEAKIQEAKAYARELFYNGKWNKGIYPLSWLIKKFWPVRGWTEEDLLKIK